MTRSDWFKISTQKLKANNIKSAQLDSLIILEHVLKISRTKLLVHFDQTINDHQKKLLNHYLKLRLNYLPIAYITNSINFYGFNFYVNQNVLIPRPESEEIVTKANLLIFLFYSISFLINNSKNFNLTGVDIGSGSGNLGISLSLINPYCRVDLIEKSKKAAQICQINVVKNNQKNQVFISDFSKINLSNYHFIIANLPYLPLKFKVGQATSHEPRTALFSGQDGLKDYRKLFKTIAKLSKKPLLIILEKLDFLDYQLIELARLNNYQTIIKTKFVICFVLSY